MAGSDEGQALILWCTRLPGLRAQAMRERWTDRLERAVVRVREGGSALDACNQFDLFDPPPPGPTRNAEPGAAYVYPAPRSSRPPLTGRGAYGCPRGLCARLDQRDDEGHPPMCALFDNEPMQPTDVGP